MPLNLNKHIQKKKKPVFIRLLRIYFGTLKHCFVVFVRSFIKLLKFLKPFFIFILKTCFWGLLFCAICIFTNYANEKIPFWLLIFVYVHIVLHHYTINKNYKDWQELSETNEFQKEFCRQWRPNILNYLLVFVFSAYYFDTFEFIIANLFVYCVELWDRRYISNSIKLDMILRNSKH